MGSVYFVEFGRQQGTPKSSDSGKALSSLFEFKEQEVKGLSIKTTANSGAKKSTQNLIVLEKESGKEPNQKSGWKLRSPQPVGPANKAIVAFLLNLLESKRDREIKVEASRRAEFGLDQPLATIDIKLENQQVHTLILGKLNFDRTGLYAIVDPPMNPKADLSILLVPPSFESAVNRPVSEWRPNPSTASTPSSTKPTPESEAKAK